MSTAAIVGSRCYHATKEAMLRSIVGWLVAAPVLVAMLLAGCSNEPATPTVEGPAPVATEPPQHTPTATPIPSIFVR